MLLPTCHIWTHFSHSVKLVTFCHSFHLFSHLSILSCWSSFVTFIMFYHILSNIS